METHASKGCKICLKVETGQRYLVPEEQMNRMEWKKLLRVAWIFEVLGGQQEVMGL